MRKLTFDDFNTNAVCNPLSILGGGEETPGALYGPGVECDWIQECGDGCNEIFIYKNDGSVIRIRTEEIIE